MVLPACSCPTRLFQGSQPCSCCWKEEAFLLALAVEHLKKAQGTIFLFVSRRGALLRIYLTLWLLLYMGGSLYIWQVNLKSLTIYSYGENRDSLWPRRSLVTGLLQSGQLIYPLFQSLLKTRCFS